MADAPEAGLNGDASGSQNGSQDAIQGAEPMVHAHAQYIKDFSFENPDALDSIDESGDAPEVSFNCAVESRKLSDATHEVVLKFEGKAMRGEKALFLVALDYAGLFTFDNVPPEHEDGVINVHCPTMLFPFARNIIANVTRDGGYPQLLIDIIDFNAMYAASLAENTGQPENTET
ncbi:MAG: protein-export chaperone SecB [Rhodospirillales bacterium]|jgi:preprotein translocase subunit SecB|nr:protein-export chaperone SecB [Rhodospirillales bacterium]MBT4006290.1 protein-export chaperone SecB [Rhodospirillales bacterium]MBT5075678.1 protein-export chaperone SecB [Rhodospirillales bacterium]MBT5112336.1 protein-export chaperone SecB [Rhodospirillales bacterium]MBT5672037.1 protein-export chaperone SecB [Rhodospirillales bacterium]